MNSIIVKMHFILQAGSVLMRLINPIATTTLKERSLLKYFNMFLLKYFVDTFSNSGAYLLVSAVFFYSNKKLMVVRSFNVIWTFLVQ